MCVCSCGGREGEGGVIQPPFPPGDCRAPEKAARSNTEIEYECGKGISPSHYIVLEYFGEHERAPH